MKRTIQRFLILTAIFFIAVFSYFFVNKEKTPEDMTYSVMEEATLPVVYAQMCGRSMNPMFGYREAMGNMCQRESLTILPEDRALEISIRGGSRTVQGIRYEIRSLDLERLVENTEVEAWEQKEAECHAVLPIQNLLTKGREYLLTIELELEQYGTAHYYTRILWQDGDDGRAASMIDLASEFSRKTFSAEEARDLVTYLEADHAEDRGNFGCTNLRSGFSQLTWGRLKMQPAGNIQISLRELDGIMGCVVLNYPVMRMAENGKEEYFEVEEAFTMKWSALRIYMMDYERKVNRIVSGDSSDFTGKQILLGIMNPDEVEAKCSPNGKVTAYRANRDLWIYRQDNGQAARAFSFREGKTGFLPGYYRKYSEKILKVSDEGDVDFLVYGYQSRGHHEGESGIAGYHYIAAEHELQELFFIRTQDTFEHMQQDLDQLCYCNGNDILYLCLDGAIYSVDMKSRESMTLADSLEEGSFVASSDQRRIAWLEGGKTLEAHTLYLQDLESGERKEIRGASEEEWVRTLGFVGGDLVYGFARPEAEWMQTGRLRERPMYALEIMNEQMQVETRYEKRSCEIVDVAVDDSRVRLLCVTQVSDTSYVPAQEDTIVCNEGTAGMQVGPIGSHSSSDQGQVYEVRLNPDLQEKHKIRIVSAEKLQSESENEVELQAAANTDRLEFFAYGAGRLLCRTGHFSTALQASYGYMGFVTDQNGRILWDRVNRSNAAEAPEWSRISSAVEQHLRDFSVSKRFSDGTVFLDARGCSLMQLLYFIGQGNPVIAYQNEGQYVILEGYDAYNITIFDPVPGERMKMGLKDATELFQNAGNDFVCVILGMPE